MSIDKLSYIASVIHEFILQDGLFLMMIKRLPETSVKGLHLLFSRHFELFMLSRIYYCN